MKIYSANITTINRLTNLRHVTQSRRQRKDERRSSEEPILRSVETIFEEAGISGSPTEKFCEIQYMIGQTLKENVIPQIQAGGPVGPFSVMVDGATAFTYPNADDFQYSVPGITGLTYNSDTISIMNPTSTWNSMSFSTENGSTTAFAATVTEQEEHVVFSGNALDVECFNYWTSSQNIILTNLIVGGVDTVDINPISDTCENYTIQGASGYFTDETKTEVVFQLLYDFSLQLDLSMTAEILTDGPYPSYLNLMSGSCGDNCDQKTPCEGDVQTPCTFDSVYVEVNGGAGQSTFPFSSSFYVFANVTFRKDSVTVDNMFASIVPNPIPNIEAVFSAGGECSILGVDIPIPSESSTNPMIGVGIDTAVVGVVSMFNGWLMAQSYTIPL